ncbi:MAG TPA: DUF2232 domain-containing protein [Firmicutes bacterium]|nr:DUF2232 domain-containing protein [Bacillota bacterium]
MEDKKTFKWAEYIFIFAFMVLIVSFSFTFMPFSLFLITLIPLPILIATYRHNTLPGVVIATLASIFFAYFLQDSTLVILVIAMATVGVGIGNAMKEGLSSKKVLIIGIVSSLITMFLLGLGLSLVTKQPLSEFYKETTDRIIEDITKIETTNEANIERVRLAINTFTLLLPSMLITGAVLIAGINFMAGSSILRKMGVPNVQALPPISNWTFPTWLSITYFILWPLSLIGTFPPVVSIIIKNLHSIVRWFLVLQGLGVLIYFLNTVRVPNWLKVIILLPVYLFSSWFLGFIGALDPWLKYRGRVRLYKEELEKEKEKDKQD